MVNKWDVCFCNLDPTQGSEQRGTRPVLVVSNNAVNHALPVCTVIPLSSLKKGDRVYPTEVMLPSDMTGLPKDSVAMVQQIRTVAHTRLQPPVGRLDNEIFREDIRKSIRMYFEV